MGTAGEGGRAGARKRSGTSTARRGGADPSSVEAAFHRFIEAVDALRCGDFRSRLAVGGSDLEARAANTFNELAEEVGHLCGEVQRMRRLVGTEGRLSERSTPGHGTGDWAASYAAIDGLLEDLTRPVAEIGIVLEGVADGDFTRTMDLHGNDVPLRGDFLRIGRTVNGVVGKMAGVTSEVTRMAREIGTEGRLGGRVHLTSASGSFKELADAVNAMADNLTAQVRDISKVATAVAQGDLSMSITVNARGEVAALADTINSMTGSLRSFAAEVTRLAREIRTEGRLGGQADDVGLAGVWRDLINLFNSAVMTLGLQVRDIAQVTTAVAKGDLSQKITVEVAGEMLELKGTVNAMVDQLSAFAAEVTRVAREVGTEGQLGGQAQVPGVGGTWRDLTDSVNSMANNLTGQVRNISQVATAVAKGDLSQKITVDARGEILELKSTMNTMVDQLSAFAAEVTRVAREVGTDGQLGGQAEVEGVSGTWKGLTDSVNQLAGNLTTQVRAIAEVATAVTLGDLTRLITVDASGEVAELKDNINQMIANLRETTQANHEQDWLKTNLAGVSGLMQGRRDLMEVAELIMTELTPAVSAQQGAFFLTEEAFHDADAEFRDALRFIAGYGFRPPEGEPLRFRPGESLIGQAMMTGRTVVVGSAPPSYVRVRSGLGEAAPASVIVLPVPFEDRVLGVIELATFGTFSELQQAFLNQLMGTIGVTVNTIIANSRTEQLLAQSQRLAEELQERSEELQEQQEELRRSNGELEEKAALLASQNRDIEIKNSEIEQARKALEERAEQLALSSRYKTEFLANMSHELRTPLNSLLILARLLADNHDRNLTSKQVEFAETIHSAGSDLLQLINDILDLSKVEAGKMEAHPSRIGLSELVDYLDATFRPLTAEKGLEFTVEVDSRIPATLSTDEQRLQQVLRNLLSNAVKFTESGSVRLRIAPAEHVPSELGLPAVPMIAFAVADSGIGIAADKLKIIFGAFQQADGTTSRKYGGTGLGLSISREIAKLLGGEIHAESDLGSGSVFTLYLPVDLNLSAEAAAAGEEASLGLVQQAAARGGAPVPVLEGHMTVTAQSKPAHPGMNGAPHTQPMVARQRAGDGSAGSAGGTERGAGDGSWLARDSVPDRAERVRRSFEGYTVLVVDDDIRNVFALTSVLEEHGFTVLYAENGVEGIDLLERHEDVALVLMDVMMPELDGYATTAAIRRMPQFEDLPIIAVTAKAMAGDQEKSLASGANDHITKPVDTERLLDVMASWLE